MMRSAFLIAPAIGVFALCMAIVVGTERAGAQSLTGQIDSVGESLPPAEPIRVSSATFTDLNQRLEPIVEKALRDQGFVVDDNAPLVLSFSTAVTAKAAQRGETSLDLGTSAPASDADPEAAIKRRNPFLKAEPRPTSGARGARGRGQPYSLSFIVARAGEVPVWRGSLSARMEERDPFDATSRLVPVLAGHVGKTMRGQPIEIP